MSNAAASAPFAKTVPSVSRGRRAVRYGAKVPPENIMFVLASYSPTMYSRALISQAHLTGADRISLDHPHWPVSEASKERATFGRTSRELLLRTRQGFAYRVIRRQRAEPVAFDLQRAIEPSAEIPERDRCS